MTDLERDIERYFVKSVQSLNGVAFKFNSLSNRGVSDRIVCLPNGETWFVELKKEGGKLSALQKIFAEDMRKLKQNYACLWNREQVDRWTYDRINTTQPTSSSVVTAP
jgi:hypothetical protein